MILYTSVDDLPEEFFSGALTIGNFDGVHEGHARLIERLVKHARKSAGPSVVFTFEPHPARLLRPQAAPPPLTWVERKAELLARLGVDCVVAYPTSLELLSLSAEAFFEEIVLGKLNAKAMVEGLNFYFGKGRQGNTTLLAKLCDRSDVPLEIVTPLQSGNELISSSRIREAISAGDVASANAMLTQPYRLRGTVTHGSARGAKIGFPTANLSAIDGLLPRPGVYAGLGRVGQEVKKAAINIGPNPTFSDNTLKVEVHLLDFNRSIYGQLLEVDFLSRLRDVQNFASLEELQQQLARDIAAARCIKLHSETR